MSSDALSPVPDPKSEAGGSRRSRSRRLWSWIDRRTGVDRILRESLDEPIPGGARFAYVFGSALLFVFVSQIVTGLCLALYYAPSPMTAHASVAYIVKEVAAGSFLRSLHSYGSSAMVVVLLLHFLQTVLYGSYKGRREILWISGCTLALVVLGMTFTGYLLSWDQRAYFAGSVGTDLVGQVPFIGERLRLLLRGGATMGALTLSRFYVLHILVLPGLLVSFITVHIVLFRKAGAAGLPTEDPVTPHSAPEMFYPRQVLIDMAFVLFVMGVLGVLAHFLPATLGPEASAAAGGYLPRPEWYFLPMFQWLKYWEGWRTVIGVFVIPVLLIGLLFLLPFMDRGLERRPWRRPIPVGAVFVVLLGLLWLGLTSHLEDSRDPLVAAQLAEQSRQESAYLRAPFQPYSAASASGGGASAPLDAAAAQGKAVFDSHGCSGCHGEGGVGARGPALTHISSRYQPAQLTSLLTTPTAKMKAGGMPPVTLSASDLKALVSYLTSLGTTAGAPGGTPPGSGSYSPAPDAAVAGATAAPSKAQTRLSAGVATSGNKSPGKALPGEKLYQSQGCVSCHGGDGKGTPRAPALIGVGRRMSAAQLTSLLQAPNAKMKAGGMPPVTVSSTELASLVAYLGSLSSKGVTHGPAGRAPGAPEVQQPATATAPAAAALEPAPPPSHPAAEPDHAGGSRASAAPTEQPGAAVFVAQGCAACHGAGGIGTSRAPALTALSKTKTPAALTSLLQHPTDKMHAGGMPPVKLSDTDMSALVAYLESLGTSPASPAGGPPSHDAASASGSPGSADAGARSASQPALNALESKGQAIFKAHRCADCHGTDGLGGTVAAPALADTGKSLAPALLTTMLQRPTVRMQQGGMPPLSLSKDELVALVAYVSHISASKGTPQ